MRHFPALTRPALSTFFQIDRHLFFDFILIIVLLSFFPFWILLPTVPARLVSPPPIKKKPLLFLFVLFVLCTTDGLLSRSSRSSIFLVGGDGKLFFLLLDRLSAKVFVFVSNMFHIGDLALARSHAIWSWQQLHGRPLAHTLKGRRQLLTSFSHWWPTYCI